MSNIRRIAEIHIEAARERALRIFAFSGAVYPSEWGKTYVDVITRDLLEFAFHARRINEICAIDCNILDSVNTKMISISENDPGGWVERYDYALNRLMHARDFKFGSAHANHRQLFLGSESNLMPLYVRITTDERSEATVSIFGIAFCFLTEIIPIIKIKFPEWQF